MAAEAKSSIRKAPSKSSVGRVRDQVGGAPEAAEVWYKTLVDMAGDVGLGIAIVHDTDEQQGTVVFVNDRACRMIGRARREVVGACVWDLLSAESVSVARERYERRLSGEDVLNRYEVVAVRGDGTPFSIEIAMSTMDYQGRPAVVVYALDIGERKAAEATLRESEQRYAALVSNLADAVLTSSGVITWCNDRAEEVFGYTRDEMIGSDGSLFFPEAADVEKWTETTHVVTGEHGHFSGTTTIRRKDGSIADIEFSIARIPDTHPPEFVTVARDVTERKRTEQEAKDAMERFQILFEYAPDGYYLLTGEGYFVDGNRMAEQISGYKREELIGRNLLDVSLISEEELTVAVAELAQNSQGVSTGPTEFNLRRKDGSSIVIESRAFPVRVKDQDLVLGIARDATERKRAEQALQKAHDELEIRVEERTSDIGRKNKQLRKEVAERRRAEQELRRSQEQFYSLFHAMSEGVALHEVIYDDSGEPVDCVILDVNPAYESMIGLRKEQVAGRRASEFLDPRRVGYFGVCAQVARTGNPASFETYFEPADKHFSVSVFSPGKGKFATVLFDISENKRAGEALKASEEKYRLVVENANEAIVVAQDGMLKLANPKVVEITGYSQEELAAMPFVELIHPDDRQMVAEKHLRRLAGEELPSVYSFRIVGKDGAVTWAEINAVLITWRNAPATLNFLTDITERKEAEEALRHSEQYFRSLIENALDVIVIVGADGSIRYESAAVKRVLGYEPEELIGLDGFGFAHPDDMPRVTDTFAYLMENPGSTTSIELRVRSGDGAWRMAEAVARNLIDDPLVQGIVVNFRDVTERKQVEEEKRRVEQQLEIAGRLAAVGELAAGVAHELNNPLSAVQAFAQFLSQSDNLDEAVRGDVETIYREAQRATRITGNLLSFARRERPEKSPTSMNEVLDRSLELHAYRMKVNNIEVVREFDPQLPTTMADSHQMQQVFVNLITNAEHAMSEAHGRGRLVVKTAAVGRKIRVSFVDDGPGIVEGDLKRIFDPFFTTKEVGKGTGLGLSICYGIVESHGGHLYARSNPGEGATFIVDLPLVGEGGTTAECSDAAGRKEA